MRAALTGLVLPALILAAVLASTQRSTFAYPEPSIVPRSWEFDFEIDKPRAIAVKDVSGKLSWYWFITYKVTNNTQQERLFIPETTIATDEGDILTPGRNVPFNVFDAIKKKVGNTLLENPSDIVGRILQGEDNARESVIIWPALDHHVSEVKVFMGGLSGETTVIKNPRTGENVLMSKTLMLTYKTPGKPLRPQQQTVIESRRDWVMR